MKQYLDIVEKTLDGEIKENRTGIDTLATFDAEFRHDMSEGFPLLTTKKTHIHSIAVELEGFINGITSKQWYKDRKCRIWNEWANPVEVKRKWDEQNYGVEMQDHERKALQASIDDLGPIYGYQWRNFGEHYCFDEDNWYDTYKERPNGVEEGFDQLDYVVKTLKNKPNDRRMVVSAWNPNQIHMMALPPCHYSFTVVHINGVLNLSWKQRSCDLMLGVPFNIASYALLMTLLCTSTGMKPGILTGHLEDCHIYVNQIDGAKLQLGREPRKLPTINISEPDIFKWTHNDYKIEDYNPHDKIDFGPVAI